MKIAQSAARIGRIFARIPGTLPAALVALGSLATGAQAIPVLSAAGNLVVPNTTAGIYVNVVSAVSNVAPASAPGWDINPFSSTALSFFNPTAPTGGVYAISIAGQVANLPLGTVIGPATAYGSGAATTTAATFPWVLNATNYFGFRFIGDDTQLHYGWGTMIVGATLSTRTLGELWYENAPSTPITITAVPEASTVGMMLAGLGVGALVLRRRRLAA